MSRFKVLDELPGKQYGKTRDWSPAIDIAMEHEGKWVEADVGMASSAAYYRAKTLREAAHETVKRIGLKSGFSVAVRKNDEGKYAVYLRKSNGAPL